VWATQRSDPDFAEATRLQLPIAPSLSCLPLGNDNVAIVKKRKKLNKERKERFWGRFFLENGQEQK
jgi:hypothetical protein